MGSLRTKRIGVRSGRIVLLEPGGVNEPHLPAVRLPRSTRPGQRSNSQPTRRTNRCSRPISAFSIKGSMIHRHIAPTGLWSVAAPAADRA